MIIASAAGKRLDYNTVRAWRKKRKTRNHQQSEPPKARNRNGSRLSRTGNRPLTTPWRWKDQPPDGRS